MVTDLCVLLAWCRFELDTPVVWLHTCMCCWVYTFVVWLETCVHCWVYITHVVWLHTCVCCWVYITHMWYGYIPVCVAGFTLHTWGMVTYLCVLLAGCSFELDTPVVWLETWVFCWMKVWAGHTCGMVRDLCVLQGVALSLTHLWYC